MSNKARGWLDHAEGADSHEDRILQSAEDDVQVEWYFTEPADMRANAAATFAPRNLGGWFVDIGIEKRGSAA